MRPEGSPRAEVSKNNLDFVLRTFLARVAYFIFLDAWVAGRGGAWSGNAVARVLPFALMAIPAAFAWKFVKRLSPDLRTYLFRLITSRRMRVAVGLEALAVLCLTAAAVVPELVRPPIIGAAAASALVSRLTQVDQIKGALKGLPDRPVIGTWILWLVAVILGLFAAFGFASAVTGGGAGAAGVALAFALPCAGILYLIKRRSRKRWT
jgi:hypothetical protein